MVILKSQDASCFLVALGLIVYFSGDLVCLVSVHRVPHVEERNRIEPKDLSVEVLQTILFVYPWSLEESL